MFRQGGLLDRFTCDGPAVFPARQLTPGGLFLKESPVDDNQIETEIQAKGLTAPRVTPADVEANIASEHYGTASHLNDLHVHSANGDRLFNSPQSLQLLTICVLVLRNGFTVTGESACASPENFDAEVGRKIARQNAINKVWPLMGYELKSRLALEAAKDEETHL